MSLSDANTIQANSGTSTTATSHVVSLPSGTTAGNTLIIVTYSANAFSAIPSGFVLDTGGGAGAVAYYRKSDIAAAETSWTFTTAVSADVDWFVEENDNIDPSDPFEVTANNSGSTADGGTLSSGTTGQNAGLSVKSFAAFGTVKNSAATASWSAYTNGFEEVADVSGSSVAALAVAQKFQEGTTATFSTTATLARSDAANTAVARVVVYRGSGSPIMAPLQMINGFEYGTHGGISNTGATSLTGYTLAPTGTWGTNFLIQAASARSSGYGLRIVNSASTGAIPLGVTGTVTGASYGMNVRVVSATGTVQVASFAARAYLMYDASTNKFGAKATSTGTAVWQSGTTALNTWVWVDMGVKVSASGTVHVEWRIETATDTYTDQTYAETTGTGFTNLNGALALGSTTSQTMTADYDDAVISAYYAAHPVTPHQVRILVPETTGASVSGTSTNFSEFTANGTLAAFASTSGQRIDEIPPTVSASSDGVVQTAVAASDYMEFPMGTYTCASDEIIAAVRAYFAEWGGTGTGTGTIGYRGYDGATETTFVAASASYDADSLTSVSSTYPLWKTSMWLRTNGWTQAALNAAALRVGFSTDATPDMGISAAYLETAIRKAPAVRQVTLEDPMSATVDIYVHPYTSASVSYLITNNDASRAVNFDYSVSGTPQTTVTCQPLGTQTVTVNADNFGDISDAKLTPA